MLLRNPDSWQDNMGDFLPSSKVFPKKVQKQLDNGLSTLSDKFVRRTTSTKGVVGTV